ncbi:uncharacterized protein [Typha latifolia]|uniref:uncharacterized protein n=1 Tax=Typha latifolia TaxID=4733 RepID=UPI003C2CAEC8
MPCFAVEFQPKLSSNYCKSLPTLIRDGCAQCHLSCLRTPSSLSSDDENPDTYIDTKQVIILEIRSRAMKAKYSKPNDFSYSSSSALSWPFSPTTGKALTSPKRKRNGEEECDNDIVGDGEGSEAFFSVKSCFSRCSSHGASESKEFQRPTILEEFCHCEGWPFGLRRRAVMLPPLPSSPSDSWMWHKKNLVTKTCTTN